MKIAIETLGCKANQYDSAFIAAQFKDAGHDIVSFKTFADVYIINSCTVTAKADYQTRQLIRRARNKNPNAIVVACGCYVDTDRKALEDIEEVDLFFSNNDKDKILDVILRNPLKAGNEESSEHTGSFTSSDAIRHRAPIRMTHKTTFYGAQIIPNRSRAFLKIQDGCSHNCTYCIIPRARGESRSLQLEEVMKHLHSLSEAGYHEAILVGIQIGQYKDGSDNNFLKLLSEIEKVKPIHRVRLSSLNPDEINDEMIELVSASNTLCSHWHIATQSLSDNVLKGMKRRYNRSRFIDVVTKISHGSKGPFAIGTDIITGFPGESDNDFKDTYDALNDLPVDYMHVFPYSKRGKTPAAVMTNQVSDQIKDDRKKKLLELSIKKRKSFYNRYLDQTLEVIVENKKHLKTGKLRGISGNYIPILFDGSNSLLRSVSSVTITNVDETLTVFGELS